MNNNEWEEDDDNLDRPMAAGQRNRSNETQLERILRDHGQPFYRANDHPPGAFLSRTATPSSLDEDARERPESRGRKEDS